MRYFPPNPLRTSVTSGSNSPTVEYIPDGLTKEQWAKEKAKLGPKSGLGRGGTSGMKFRSRSMEEFQRGREAGKLEYNMPMFNAKEKLRKGLIKESDIPYMQRAGGRADNSDTKDRGNPYGGVKGRARRQKGSFHG